MPESSSRRLSAKRNPAARPFLRLKPIASGVALACVGLLASFDGHAACTAWAASTVPAGTPAAGQTLWSTSCTGLTQNTYGVHGLHHPGGGYNLRYVVEAGATVRATGNGGDAFSGFGLTNTAVNPYTEIINYGTVEAVGTGAASGSQLNENAYGTQIYRNFGLFRGVWVGANPAALQDIEWHNAAGATLRGDLIGMELGGQSILINNDGLIEGTLLQASNGYYTLAKNPFAKPTSTLAISLITGDATLNQMAGEVRGDVFAGGARTARVNVSGGVLNGDAYLSAGADVVDLTGGTVNGDIYTQVGDDMVTVGSHAALHGLIHMGDGSDTLHLNAANITTIPTLNGGDDVSAADGFVDTLNLNQITGARQGDSLINWERIRLHTGSDLTLTGHLVTGAGNDASNQAMGLFVNTASTLRMGASAVSVTGDVHNAGTITLRGATPGTVLNVQGNYIGNGGVLQLNTVFGGDGSATDKLVVSGNTSGGTTLQVANVGGTGAATVNGIKVVDVGGTSASSDFALASPVQAGAFEYTLKRREDSDFYLVSEYLTAPGNPGNPGTPGTPGTPEAPGTPAVTPTPPVAPPQVLRPAVAGYMVGQMAMQNLSQGLMGRLHQRVGEQNTVQSKDGHRQTWVRLNGEQVEVDGARQFGLKQTQTYFQLGKDLNVSVGNAGGAETRAHTGVTLGVAHTSMSSRNWLRSLAQGTTTGSMKGEMATVGAYHTRYDDQGGYLDLVGQLQFAHNKYNDIRGITATQRGTGVALSAEVGREYGLGDSDWAIQPQGQLSYSLMRYRAFADTVSRVGAISSESLRGRVGFRLNQKSFSATRAGYTAPNEGVYFTVNLVHEFMKPKAITVAQTRISETFDSPTWFELGVGGQIKLRKDVFLHGGLQALQSTGSGRKGFAGQVGVRWNW